MECRQRAGTGDSICVHSSPSTDLHTSPVNPPLVCPQAMYTCGPSSAHDANARAPNGASACRRCHVDPRSSDFHTSLSSAPSAATPPMTNNRWDAVRAKQCPLRADHPRETHSEPTVGFASDQYARNDMAQCHPFLLCATQKRKNEQCSSCVRSLRGIRAHCLNRLQIQPQDNE